MTKTHQSRESNNSLACGTIRQLKTAVGTCGQLWAPLDEELG